jgi:hypothetical protein
MSLQILNPTVGDIPSFRAGKADRWINPITGKPEIAFRPHHVVLASCTVANVNVGPVGLNGDEIDSSISIVSPMISTTGVYTTEEAMDDHMRKKIHDRLYHGGEIYRCHLRETEDETRYRCTSSPFHLKPYHIYQLNSSYTKSGPVPVIHRPADWVKPDNSDYFESS